MRVELDRMKQLEEVRRQFDKELRRFILEVKQANATIARLEKELDRCGPSKTDSGDTSVGSSESSASVSTSESSVEEGLPVARRRVTFVESDTECVGGVKAGVANNLPRGGYKSRNAETK